jgi:glycine dehydrogenase subunit 1
VVEALADRGVLGGVPVSRLLPEEDGALPLLLVAATETTTEAEIETFEEALAEVLR